MSAPTPIDPDDLPFDDLSVAHIILWLAPQLPGVSVVAGRLPDVPNKIVGVVSGSSGSLEMDNGFEVATFTISCRGVIDNYVDAEILAHQVDRAIIDPRTDNFELSDHLWVCETGRYGGRPEALTNPSDLRYTFTCNYYFKVSR